MAPTSTPQRAATRTAQRHSVSQVAQICAALSDLIDQYGDVWPEAIWQKFDYALAHLYLAEQALAEDED